MDLFEKCRRFVRARELVEAGIDPSSRPETVGLEQYVALSNLLKPV